MKKMKLPTEIRGFFGEWRFLSNFHLCNVVFEGEVYPSTEHAYQAAKALDPEAREKFRYAGVEPRHAKKMGGALKLRPDWEEVKVAVMRDLLMQKFYPTILRRKLLCTFTAELVEANWWHDRWWGVCCSEYELGGVVRKCKQGPHESEGLNHLGRLLMEVRTYYASYSKRITTGTITQLSNPHVEGDDANLCDYQQGQRQTVCGADRRYKL